MYLSCLAHLEKLYGKFGFTRVGEFWNTELDDNYAVMYLNVADFFEHPERLQSTGLRPQLREMLAAPIEVGPHTEAITSNGRRELSLVG